MRPARRAERAGRRPSLLSCARVRAGEPSEPGFGGLRPQPREKVDRCAALAPPWPAGKEAEAGRAGDTARQVDAGPKCPASVGARSRLASDKRRWRARRAGASGAPRSAPRCRPASLHLPALFLRQVQRTPQGEELAVSQAEGGSQKKRDKTPGGGGAHPKGDQSRLFRDLRVETKARVAWARHLQENPNARKNKGKGNKKGCFGLKLDRIGSTSGLGC